MRIKEASVIIQKLLDALPDSHHESECWEWCWNELNEDAQEYVKRARGLGQEYLERSKRPPIITFNQTIYLEPFETDPFTKQDWEVE